MARYPNSPNISIRQMKEIIYLSVDDKGLSEISRETGLSKDTVYKWQQKFELREKKEK